MGFNFVGGDREQLFLLPASVADWLPAGHLAWFVVDVVSELDLSAFRARYRADGRGGAAYDPAVMVAVLLYAYCVGERSSRRIEKRLAEDVAFRVVAANAQPDHATVARFRGDHETAVETLFAQVLALCVAAGLVKVGVVALDGTKIEAAAAKTANMDGDRLDKAMRAEARRILDEAKAVDAAEDELFGDARGDELPAELADRSRRLARLREAKARLVRDRERQAEAAADDIGDDDTPSPTAGSDPNGSPGRAGNGKRVRVNVTDPDSKLMKIQGGFCQGYNAQAVASEDQIVIAAELTDSPVDVQQLQPMVDTARANLEAAGSVCPMGVLVADAGYYSTANATVASVRVLIATGKRRDLPTQPVTPSPADRIEQAERAEAELIARRQAVLDRVAAGEINLSQAARQLALSWSQTQHWWRQYQTRGVDGLTRKHRAPGEGPHPRLQHRADTKARMNDQLASPEGQALYRRRAQIIEPVFGQIKDPRGIRRFQRRGLAACASEWKLITATHNLLKLWRHRPTTTLAIP